MTKESPDKLIAVHRPSGKNIEALLWFYGACKRGEAAVFKMPEGDVLSPKALEKKIAEATQIIREETVEECRKISEVLIDEVAEAMRFVAMGSGAKGKAVIDTLNPLMEIHFTKFVENLQSLLSNLPNK